MYTLICCFLIISLICIINITINAYNYTKTIKNAYENSKDETELHDCIEIGDNLINLDAIIYINYGYDTQEKIYILNIILNNGERLFFKFDTTEKVYNIYQQIIEYLDPAIITID